MWVGAGAIVMSISVPGVDPAELQCTAQGTCLLVRGTGPASHVSHQIDLPYSVYDKPIAIGKGREENALYLLLKKSP